MDTRIDTVERYYRTLQDKICSALAEVGGKNRFRQDIWHHDEGGGGDSRVMEHDEVFEKCGVNFSSIQGLGLPAAATAQRKDLRRKPFAATGLSLVCHPENPYVPTAHMNVRYLEIEGGDWWFGGGFDLTPCYGFVEDGRHWHQVAHDVCAEFGEGTYERLKASCDEYFYLAHRNETRGIGGLFFDDLNEGGFERCFKFSRNVGNRFLDAYLPIVKRRMNMEYSERQRQFQLYRRGRYVEFNLIHDRGTLFGLQSGGRTESILMSLPPLAAWRYCWEADEGSPEQRLREDFLTPRDWLNPS